MHLSAATHEKIRAEIAHYPNARGALLYALHLARDEAGALGKELFAEVGEYFGMRAGEVAEVASFYSMFETEKVGRHNVAFCTNISCWLNGAEDLVKHAEQRLGCKLGESTADGRIYLKREEECVAGCCGAPVVVINGHYHEKLDAKRVDELLDELK